MEQDESLGGSVIERKPPKNPALRPSNNKRREGREAQRKEDRNMTSKFGVNPRGCEKGTKVFPGVRSE